MARKTKAQEKEAEASPNADKKLEEKPKEQLETPAENEPKEEVNPETSTAEKAPEAKETAKPAEEKPKAAAESSPPAAQPASTPQTAQSSTIEKPPSSSGIKTTDSNRTAVIASHLPNTLIDSTLKFFVGGLHPNTDEAELSNYFAKYGQILSTQVMRDLATGRHRGFGFVTLKVQPNSMSVFKDTHTVTGKRIDVRAMQSDVAASLRKKIFVGGLSKALNEEMLEEYFSKFGEVDKVTIMRQLDGTSRGFGFIVFTTDEAASGALRNPTHFVYGNKVDVRAAETRPKSNNQTHVNPVYPYAMMHNPADMYSAASHMYRHQGTYDPSQYANMSQHQMSQQQYPQYQQYQLLQQQMVQQQMAMAGTYGGYYNTSGQQTTPGSATTSATPNPYAAASGSSIRAHILAAYGAYRGKNDPVYPGVNQNDHSNSRGYRQQPY